MKHLYKHLITILVLLTQNVPCCLSVHVTTSAITTKSGHELLLLNTLYGDITVQEPVLIALLKDPYMQRLQKIRQYGVRHYVIKEDDYTRYDHSVGVFALLRLFGAPLKEQIAGLLHDVSHTVFSHVGDYIFTTTETTESYQDIIHSEFLKQTTLAHVLNNHGFTVEEVLAKNRHFTALEQDLPNICADRLEYNLHGGILENLITYQDIHTILNDLHFDGANWVFSTPEIAKKFAYISLYHTQFVWGSRHESNITQIAANILKRALATGLLSKEDIHFSTDDVVWENLKKSDDEEIIFLMKQIREKETTSSITTNAKFRGIDPWIKTANGLQRLTTIDAEFQEYFLNTKLATDKRACT